MKKILTFALAGALACGLASSTSLDAQVTPPPEQKTVPAQKTMEVFLLCKSRVVFQGGEVAGVHLEECRILQPTRGMA